MNPVVRKILKVFAWITGSIIGLLILLLILIQIPAIQNFAKNRAVAYLQKKLKTKVSINKLSIAFPKEVVLKGVYFEDQHKDTLLYGKEIRADIALLKLLSKKVEINYAELDGVKTHIYRVKPDTAFNFGYIVKAFAGTDTSKSPADTSGSGMSFTVNRVVLKDILATFKDDNSGNDVYFYLGSFDTKIKKLDPGKSKYSISGISMSGIDARVRQYKPYVSQKTGTALKKAAPAATTQTPAPDISLDELTIQNTKFSYNDEVAATQANIQIGNFTTHPENINTQNLFINLKDAALKNSRAAVTINKPAAPPPPKENDTTQSVNWHIATSKILLDNEEIVFNNNTQPVQKRGIDYNHLHITALNLDAGAMNFTPSSYSGNIKNASFNERCGFALQKLSTDFYYTDTTAILRNLLVQAGRTLLKDKLAVKYKSLNDISQHIGNMYIDANLSNSTVDPKDILTFAPQLSENLKGIHNALLHINTTVTGYVKNLSIPVLTVSGIGATFVDLSGHIRGLPDAANALYDIKINTLKTTSADINALVPPSAMPASLRIPAQLSARGYFRGSTKDADTRLQLTSSSGNAFVKGGLHHEAYNAEVILNNLNVGYLTKQDSTIGAVTLTATAKGHDFDLKKAVADVQAKVQSFQLKGYTYKNLTLHGKATGGRVNVTGNMLDSNLRFNLTAGAGITTKYPSDVSLILRIDTANLQALHLADTIGLHGTINASLPSVNPDSLTGKISLAGFTITTPNKVLVPDSMLITADANGQHRSLDIKSDFLTARLAGIYTFTGISQALRQTINQYYNIPGYRDTTVEAEDWQLDARLTPTPFLLQAVSGMKGTDSITLHTTFNSLQRNLSASLKAKKIAFNNVRANSLNISAATVPGKLSFSASAQGIHAGSAVINHTIVSGYVSNNKVNIALDVHDAGDKPQYNIAGLLQHITGGIKFSLNQSGLMLNYDNWAVAPDNFIAYDSSGLLVNNFNISNTNQSLSVNSQTKSPDAPLQVKFSNFRISTLTKMANTDNLMLGGIINGDAVVKNITTNPVFTSNLVIDSVVYQKDTIGTIAIKVNNEQANAFAANVTVKGKNNDIALAGTYFSGESRMDMKLDINRLDLAAVKPFAAGQLDDAGGELKGHVSIGGTTSKPSVTGSINFINAYIVPAISGERFTLDRQDVSVDSRGIHFNNFTLLDSAKNKAIVDGDILTDDFMNYRFATSLTARNFTIINAQKTPNRLFYGKLNLNTRLTVNGDMSSPTATGTIRINPSTDFTMILPTEDPEIEEREGIVNFVDKDHPDTFLQKTIYDSLATSALRGIDVNANIETDSSAKLTLVIDENTGDALTMQGVANLNGGIDKSGKISLTGSYQLTNGSYQVSLSVLKRKFQIQPGSTITWTGDPTTAQVDITAVYAANTAPIDLVEQQLGGSQQDLTRFKQTLPFQVLLQLEGDLLKPVITFDIKLPQDLAAIYPEVDLQLQQIRQDPSELNKQVFALLLLNRFVQQDPFASSGGSTTAGQLAVQSAGRILGEQLNNLAASLIKGVDINFDVNSEQDYSTGVQQTRTDVNVSVSKKLLNDRLVVNVGGNVGLQGPANNVTAVQNSSVSGNFSVDYKLSRDGRYRLRAYRQNDYQEIIEGQVMETGVSFILTMDYDKFKELFQKRKRGRRRQQIPAGSSNQLNGKDFKPQPANNQHPTAPGQEEDSNDNQ